MEVRSIMVDQQKFEWNTGLRLLKHKYGKIEDLKKKAWIEERSMKEIEDRWGSLIPLSVDELNSLSLPQREVCLTYVTV